MCQVGGQLLGSCIFITPKRLLENEVTTYKLHPVRGKMEADGVGVIRCFWEDFGSLAKGLCMNSTQFLCIYHLHQGCYIKVIVLLKQSGRGGGLV